MGDSTVWGSVPRQVAPCLDPLEEVVRKRLACGPDLPPVEVINRGQDNDTIQRLLAERYEQDITRLPGPPADFVFVRYGINDQCYLADWTVDFPRTYHELIGRLRRDLPRALITLETIIPYLAPPVTREVNDAIRRIAADAGLPVLDTHGPYAAILADDPNRLSYRRIPLDTVPAARRERIPTDCIVDANVIALDSRLDLLLKDIPDWYADRHPNPEGYQVIGAALAGYLAPLVCRRSSKIRGV